MRFVLLTGAGNNCGDHLIASRAKKLFAKFLPTSEVVEISRLKPYDDREIKAMKDADCVVITGGPSIRNDSAEILQFAPLIRNGVFEKIDTPFVIMGGGAGGNISRKNKLEPTPETRVFFDKIQSSPYFSGTRDFQTLRLLNNSGLDNVMFSSCPAMHPFVGEIASAMNAQDTRDITSPENIVFSCGSPFRISIGMMNQHLDVVNYIGNRYPKATIKVAFHHTPYKDEFSKTCHHKILLNWVRLHNELDSRGYECVDISGGVGRMLDLYAQADLHIGYRVHAHVLMTSWNKRSILICEDVRGTAMSEVVQGCSLQSWREYGFVQRTLRHIMRCKEYKREYLDLHRAIDMVDGSCSFCSSVAMSMAKWFAQFQKGSI